MYETFSKYTLLARSEGVFAEPASCISVAAFSAHRDGRIAEGSKVVCVLTGTGLRIRIPQWGFRVMSSRFLASWALSRESSGSEITVKGSTTTANLGPGFDCLGMALSLYNEVEFRVDGEFRLDLQPARCAEGHRHEKGISGQSVSILSDGKPNLTVPLAKNLVYQSFVRASDVLGLRLPPVTIEI